MNQYSRISLAAMAMLLVLGAAGVSADAMKDSDQKMAGDSMEKPEMIKSDPKAADTMDKHGTKHDTMKREPMQDEVMQKDSTTSNTKKDGMKEPDKM